MGRSRETDESAPRTNWWDRDKYKFEIMHQIAHADDAGRQRAAARGWRDLASKFETMSHNVRSYKTSLGEHWDSPAGDAFVGHLETVAGSIDSAARNFRQYAEVLEETATAVEYAQQEMNKISKERSDYLKEKDDYQNHGDETGDWEWLKDTGDFFSDMFHDGNIDPAVLKGYDDPRSSSCTSCRRSI